ncbi:hypothetical protein H2198_005577 [Neophaeococcomyces mojaviensis]|uniref:Uncharacterized protein n=1 Tax=Neophaeococcomyces mojaviensis TaxID=3383035 RepID=A0ACC3A5J4_9EURO|nr:hypothetical protein H2198_005577 [Knufia sp. JES_112]
MDALIRDIKDSDAADKSIVFSQWTSTMDLIGRHLHQEFISFEHIDGNTEIRRWQETLERLEREHTFSVLIMTTGVGGFGLNLIAANRVFIVEPHWNPSIGLQVISRTMRIGQLKPVHVTRYIVHDTVEKDIQQLQQRKLQLAGMARMMDSTDTSSSFKPEA